MSTGTFASKSRRLFSKDDLDALGLLLAPSWLSGLCVLVASVMVVIGSVAVLHYKGSSLQLVLNQQLHQPNLVSTNFTTFENKLNSSALVSDVPLVIFWTGVGLIVYYLVVAVADAFRGAMELKDEMSYVHANRRAMLLRAILHLALRAGVLAAWILFASYTLHRLFPYTVALSYAGSGPLGWLYNSTYLAAALAVAIVCLHLHVVLLRLLVLKPRIFG